MRVYYDRDADVNLVKDKKIAIAGYGSQGHAHALNLRDSGCQDIVIVLRPGSGSAKKAENDGFKVMIAADAAKKSDIFMVLTPDEGQAALYSNHLHENLKEGSAIAFAHGLNVHFGLIEARADLDVFMIAPKGPGHTVRSEYVRGAGVPGLIAVAQDASGNAQEIGISYAAGLGAGRAGIVETTFKEECETDLFGEQAVLCAGLSALVSACVASLFGFLSVSGFLVSPEDLSPGVSDLAGSSLFSSFFLSDLQPVASTSDRALTAIIQRIVPSESYHGLS